MRLKHRTPGTEASKPARMEPMAEGLIPLRMNGQRDFDSMDDASLREYAKSRIEEMGIASRTQMSKKDSSLYEALRTRNLLGIIALDSRGRDWRSMDDEQLINHAKRFIEERGISTKTDICRADKGLYGVLVRRRLTGRLGIKDSHRNWNEMTDEEILAYAGRLIEENKVSSKNELERLDCSLVITLRNRDLLDRLERWRGQKMPRDWASMEDDAVLALARRFVAEHGIAQKSDISHDDSGLYHVLKKRRLFTALGFQDDSSVWENLSDEELVAKAKSLIGEGVDTRARLAKRYSGLSKALQKRGILDQVGLRELRSSWTAVPDEQLIALAKSFMGERGITDRKSLKLAHPKLYDVIYRRKLQESIGFEDKLTRWRDLTDDELVGRASALMAMIGISSPKELERADLNLYNNLVKRGLQRKLPFAGGLILWHKMTDEEIIAHASRLIAEKGIRNRRGLNDSDGGLYNALLNRGLMDQVGLTPNHIDWAGMCDDDLLEAARHEIKEKGYSRRGQMQKGSPGIYKAITKRGLLERILPTKGRKWSSMSDEDVIAYARMKISENHLHRRVELENLDSGLYAVLLKRQLVDQAFASVSESNGKEAVEGVLEALDSFGDSK